MALYPLLRPFAFALDAERAHRATIAALKLLPAGKPAAPDPILSVRVAGLDFPNPVGLAAGFDKDAEVLPADARPRLRLRRGRDADALAAGGQSEAAAVPAGRGSRGDQPDGLQQSRAERAADAAAAARRRGLVGVNIGANKDSVDRIADYVAGVAAMAGVADYLTVNITSPNTPGLRELQDEGALSALLSAVSEARPAGGPPIFLKVAPDLGAGEPDQIVRVAAQHKVDAIIVANTTVSRPPLKSRYRDEVGGLSGEPLRPLALKALRDFRAASGGVIPLIGVGGIASVDDAWQRIRAGASLVQLYTAMVYQGSGLARRIALGLAERLEREGFSNISEAVGSETA